MCPESDTKHMRLHLTQALPECQIAPRQDTTASCGALACSSSSATPYHVWLVIAMNMISATNHKPTIPHSWHLNIQATLPRPSNCCYELAGLLLVESGFYGALKPARKC